MSSAECRVHLVGVNRLSACREFFGVHSWQNGTRCRDGVKDRSQKIDNLPILVTRRSGALAMLSSKVNSPVAHGSTR